MSAAYERLSLCAEQNVGDSHEIHCRRNRRFGRFVTLGDWSFSRFGQPPFRRIGDVWGNGNCSSWWNITVSCPCWVAGQARVKNYFKVHHYPPSARLLLPHPAGNNHRLTCFVACSRGASVSRIALVVCSALVFAAALFDAPQQANAQTLRQRLQKSREAKAKAAEPPAPAAPRKRNAPRQPAKTPAAANSVAQWVNQLDQLQPKEAAGYADLPLEQFAQGVSAVEYWTGQLARFEEPERQGQVLLVAEHLLAAKSRIDRQLEKALGQRIGFAAVEPDERRRMALENYLWATSSWIDLSGRLRYLLFDALTFAADEVVAEPGEYARLLDLLTQHKSSVGAVVVSSGLFDPPRSEVGAIPVSISAKLRILQLTADSGNYELVPELARLIKHPNISARLL